MGLAKIRKIVTVVEDTFEEGGQEILPPTRRAAAVAVIENPFAGTYQDDLETLMAIGEELGGLLPHDGLHLRAAVPGERDPLNGVPLRGGRGR